MMTPFRQWLFSQAERSDPVGDLARDARQLGDFPHDGTLDDLHNYLKFRFASAAARQALNEAWREWNLTRWQS